MGILKCHRAAVPPSGTPHGEDAFRSVTNSAASTWNDEEGVAAPEALLKKGAVYPRKVKEVLLPRGGTPLDPHNLSPTLKHDDDRAEDIMLKVKLTVDN